MADLLKQLSRLVMAAVLWMPVLTTSARGGPVFTNLVLGQYYNTSIATPITGSEITNGRKGIVLGVEFTPNANFTFSEVQLALGLAAGTNSIDVYLESDCGNLPCQTIEQLLLNNKLEVGASSIVTVDATTAAGLHSGTPYWLVLTAGASDTVAYWYENIGNDFASSTDFLVGFSGTNQGPWTPYDVGQLRPAFEIDGNPVSAPPNPAQTPEPSSLILVIFGSVIMISVLRRLYAPDC